MKTLYLDCGMGAAGDMLAAALLELHPDPDAVIEALNRVFDGRVVLSAKRDQKCGINGTHFTVTVDGIVEGDEHHIHTDAHHHHHTSVQEVEQFIRGLALPEKVISDALAVYRLIAEAESQVHGHPVENIHFHEVGSLDAMADVVSVCYLIHELAPERILASPVHVGSGTVRCAHGILPVPAPATQVLLTGVPIYSGDIQGELCTPTGAALIKHFVHEFCEMPMLRVEKIGYGTGFKDFPRANILRALLGEAEASAKITEQIIELACNLDDMTPEELGFAMDALFQAGALDVYFTTISMKKNRPAVMLTCMCTAAQREEILNCLFRHTTSLGIREYHCTRYTLSRSIHSVETQWGPVRLKRSEGYGVTREKPEYDDIRKIAEEQGLSLREVKEQLS